MSSDYEQRMQAAVAAVKNGQLQRSAAKQYRVSQSTLSRRLHSGRSRKEVHKDEQLFSPEIEDYIADWIYNKSEDAGKPPHRREIIEFAQSILKVQERSPTIGNRWVVRFFGRHPDLKTKLQSDREISRLAKRRSQRADGDQEGDQPVCFTPKCSQDLIRQWRDMETETESEFSRNARAIIRKAGKAIDLLAVDIAIAQREIDRLRAKRDELKSCSH